METGSGSLPLQSAESQDMTIPQKEATGSILHNLEERLMKLTQETCRWPLGDPREPGFQFCMEQHAPGSPYCSAHHAGAFVRARGRLDAAQE